ncbi:hypothetical protein GJAV_G00237150 [Gymnothorax javanicus]|nr:hypothetical protein GJAV_G00237150 [Gymnothorax javanicus]
MADDEDDYMSDAFLKQIEEVRPGVPMVKRVKDALKREAKHKEKNEKNRQKTYKEQERESREALLHNSISNENRGFALLQKMGYKAGQGLGKDGGGRVEPIPLNIKTDRGGIGIEEVKKRKAEEMLEHGRRKVQVKQLAERQSLEDFRARMRTEREERQAEGDLRRSQRACEQLDCQKSISVPRESWYWPKTDHDREEEGDEETEAKTEIDDDEIEELTPLDKLQILTSYLRGVHFYCIWCGTTYNDEEDLTKAIISAVVAAMDVQNYVPRLNELAQKSRLILRFEDVSTQGPDHCRTFTIRVVLDGKIYPDGTGRNKKEAKQNAAKIALDAINEEYCQQNDSVSRPIGPTESSAPNHRPKPFTQPNYVCWLNEYTQIARVTCKPIESTQPGPANTTQRCRYVVDGKEYPEGAGGTKREAKERAAKAVHEAIMKDFNKEAVDESQRREATGHNEELNQSASTDGESPRSSTRSSPAPTPTLKPETNYIGNLNNFCQKYKRVCDFVLVGKEGPPHDPEFVYKVVIDKKDFPKSKGKSAKEAKQNAARLAWDALQGQTEWDSEGSFRSSVKEQSTPSTSSTARDHKDEFEKSDQAESSSLDIVFENSPSSNKPNVACTPEHLPAVKSKIKMAPRFLNALPEENDVRNTQSRKMPGKPSCNSVFLKDFDEIEPIGKGAFGRVFKARKIIEDNPVAVKIVTSSKKAQREVLALSKLDHPNIVRYFHAWTEDTRYQHGSTDSSSSTSDSGSRGKYIYIQMELCKDGTLKDWIIERSMAYDPEKRTKKALSILQQVVQGVIYIHSEKFIHRDLKPANILFANKDKVKIGDFGLATSAASDSDETLLERTKKTGTRSYMAPEQMNLSQYDKEVDIFALGLIYFELLWKMTTESERAKIWNDVRSRNFPEQFYANYRECKLIERMLAEKPEERPDAPQIASQLAEFRTNIRKHLRSPHEMNTV